MKKMSIVGAVIIALAGCGEPVPSNPVFQDNPKVAVGTQTSEPFVERKVPTDSEMKGCGRYFIGLPNGEWGEVLLCPMEPEVAPEPAAPTAPTTSASPPDQYSIKSPYWPGPGPLSAGY